MSRRSIHSTWKFVRGSADFELLEVVIEGEIIDKKRVIRHGKTLSFSVLKEEEKKGQIGLFEEE